MRYNLLKRIGLISVLGTLLQSCATTSPSLPPSWVLNPMGAGITATGCTAWSGSMNVDRQVAMANARTALAQQIEISIAVVDKVITEKSGDAVVQNTFESISEQQTDQVLQSARASRVEIVHFDDKDQLCAMVELGEQASQVLFRNVVKTSPAFLTS